ncbi:MAG: 50S ribosomal protein L37ae [Candidatus Thermoplasmatota archaeon]|nr:50S ribosomal protein L37ae [Candidatus Thermoplasmatota archaeon]MCK5300321.1 50S ribosomal protein L37ae [Thermoplasmatales archaeon]
MSNRTKKVGSAGRFQARYGVKSRTRIRNVENQQFLKHKCPSCGQNKVKRTSTSIWKCKKCGIKFAGGAYIPSTEAGEHVDKILKKEIESIENIEEKDQGDKK